MHVICIGCLHSGHNTWDSRSPPHRLHNVSGIFYHPWNYLVDVSSQKCSCQSCTYWDPHCNAKKIKGNYFFEGSMHIFVPCRLCLHCCVTSWKVSSANPPFMWKVFGKRRNLLKRGFERIS